ncbi:MAG: aldose 1-epimerase [Rhizobacter sp.]|nr:aldose 1-epimerase [Rhizobacter sp.]
MPPPSTHKITWLEHAGQRLGLVPTLGGGVAAWQLDRPAGRLDLLRPWDGVSEDRYKLASFAMLPWSNRISAGGFEQAGHFHPIAPNRAGEPYPIHGDGWLQAWAIEQTAPGTLQMRLESHRHDGDPYDYRATQVYTLVDGGLDQSVTVTHLGAEPLPYGLGLHPWFPASAGARITAPVRGVWLSGADPLPTRHTTSFPDSWDLNTGAPATGSLIDNGYTGWSGDAQLDWPEHRLRLSLHMPAAQAPGAGEAYCLVYRPPAGPAFCFEPITHPIDAFHLPGRPGLRVLARGESMSLQVHWRVHELPA